MFWVALYHHREMQDKYLSLAADPHLGSIRLFLCVNQIASGSYNYCLISCYSEQRENACLPAHDSQLCHWSGVYICRADRRMASTPTGRLTPLVHSTADFNTVGHGVALKFRSDSLFRSERETLRWKQKTGWLGKQEALKKCSSWSKAYYASLDVF